MEIGMGMRGAMYEFNEGINTHALPITTPDKGKSNFSLRSVINLLMHTKYQDEDISNRRWGPEQSL